MKTNKKDEARETLLKGGLINDNSKLLIVIKGVSASGMTRRMRVLVNDRDISYRIADLCDLSINDKGLKVQGCGMNMVFWLADCITRKLWTKEQLPTLKGLTGNGSLPCLNYQ